jgi:uncharacterized membrane protein HdeD (DUF308 family)
LAGLTNQRGQEAIVMSHTWTDRMGTADRFRALRSTGDELRRARTVLLVLATLSVIAGLVAIAVPVAASVATAIFIGWVLLFAGAVMGAHAYVERSQERTGARALTAILTLAVGIYLLVAPLSGTVTLTFMLAVWFFAVGVIELVAARQIWGVPGAGFVAFNGALSVLLGLLIIADFPSSAGWAIGLLVGINLLFWGLRAFVLAGLLKRLADF